MVKRYLSAATAGSRMVERPGTGIQAGAHAERQGPLGVDVAEREPEGDRNAEGQEIVTEHLVESEARRRRVGA